MYRFNSFVNMLSSQRDLKNRHPNVTNDWSSWIRSLGHHFRRALGCHPVWRGQKNWHPKKIQYFRGFPRNRWDSYQNDGIWRYFGADPGFWTGSDVDFLDRPKLALVTCIVFVTTCTYQIPTLYIMKKHIFGVGMVFYGTFTRRGAGRETPAGSAFPRWFSYC